jgi:hypothetical protein
MGGTGVSEEGGSDDSFCQFTINVKLQAHSVSNGIPSRNIIARDEAVGMSRMVRIPSRTVPGSNNVINMCCVEVDGPQ